MNHVAMLISNPFRPDSRMLKQAMSMAKKQFRITIIGWDRAGEMLPEETLRDGIRVVRIQKPTSTYGIGARQLLRLPGFWRRAWAILNVIKPDLIHCHDFDTLPIGLAWGKLHSVPVIYDAREYYADLVQPRLHGLLGKLLYRSICILEPSLARLCSAVITVDDTLGTIYRKYNHKVVIIGHYPNKALTSQAAPVFTRPDLTLLYAGRLSVDRGLLAYADLLRALHARGIPARLMLVGTFAPVQEEHIFRHYIQNLESFVHVVGWVPYDKMPEVLQAADVGLALLQPVPRYIAALPVKIFEYMAAGLPVIASHFPLIASILSEIGAGVLVDPTQAEQAAVWIEEWWRNPAHARSIGEKGRLAILERYNWETLEQRLDSLYHALLLR